ncbi:MAG: CDP-6-deoxy-delta-3,4-glucoseen reductase [Gammaproteobacteria bacterium]|nr:CDP-6-deoxy-delta-3,4-glucoseen reductase [Gammaproteobacteria bacterium]
MSFNVCVRAGGHKFSVDANETILDAALRHGLSLPYGCRGGVCGACKSRLITGEVDYGMSQLPALNSADMAAGYALLCQARPLSDVTVELSNAESICVKKLPCRVARLEPLSPDVTRVYLKLPPSERLQFLAGQYIDFLLRDGRRRSFSIANAPHDDELIELHIKRIEGGRFTDDAFAEIKEKALLRLEGPFGNFYLREDSPRPIIFVAGGTGFAPVKAIIEHALAERIARPMHLYWGARSRRDLYLDALPRAWAEQCRHFRYTPVLSEPLPEDDWRGAQGYVTDAVLRDHPALNAFDVYASGPPVLVQAAHRDFIAHGLAPENFYADPFEFAHDAAPAGAAR